MKAINKQFDILWGKRNKTMTYDMFTFWNVRHSTAGVFFARAPSGTGTSLKRYPTVGLRRRFVETTYRPWFREQKTHSGSDTRLLSYRYVFADGRYHKFYIFLLVHAHYVCVFGHSVHKKCGWLRQRKRRLQQGQWRRRRRRQSERVRLGVITDRLAAMTAACGRWAYRRD